MWNFLRIFKTFRIKKAAFESQTPPYLLTKFTSSFHSSQIIKRLESINRFTRVNILRVLAPLVTIPSEILTKSSAKVQKIQFC